MNDIRGKEERSRVQPGSILRAAGASASPSMPNFNDPSRVVGTPPQTRLTVERQGEHVAKIIAYCRCGEKIVIDCDYAGASEDPQRRTS